MPKLKMVLSVKVNVPALTVFEVLFLYVILSKLFKLELTVAIRPSRVEDTIAIAVLLFEMLVAKARDVAAIRDSNVADTLAMLVAIVEDTTAMLLVFAAIAILELLILVATVADKAARATLLLLMLVAIVADKDARVLLILVAIVADTA